MTKAELEALKNKMSDGEKTIYQAIISEVSDVIAESISKGAYVNEQKVIELVGKSQILLHDDSKKSMQRKIANDWVRAKYFRDNAKLNELKNNYADNPEIFIKTALASATEPELFPTILAQEIQMLAGQDYWHRRLCRVIPIPGIMKMNWVTETAGITAYNPGEHTAATETTPTFGYVAVQCNEFRGRTYVPEVLLATSGLDLTGIVSQQCANSIMELEFTKMITGSGSGTWKGLTAETSITEVDAAAGLKHKTITSAIAATKGRFRAGQIWVTSDLGWGTIFEIYDKNDQPYWDIGTNKVANREVMTNEGIGDTDTFHYLLQPKHYAIWDSMSYKLNITGEGDTLMSAGLVLFVPVSYTDGKMLRLDGTSKTINITPQL